MMKFLIISLCVLCHLMPFGMMDKSNESDDNEEKESAKKKFEKQYALEVKAGDLADMSSSNKHKIFPPDYQEFARRFVLQYPYTQKTYPQIDEDVERLFDEAIKEAMRKADENDNSLRPVKAPPEVVLAVARQAALLRNSNPVKDRDEFLEKDVLRSGNYWNAVWKEDVSDPSKPDLRSEKHAGVLKIKVKPGSRLYKLVSITKELSQRYIYIINNTT